MGNLYFQQYQMPKKCREETNFLFVSYSCEQSEQTLSDTYDRVSLAVGTGSLVCLLFFISIRFKREQGKIIQIEWDLATCTAGDYTVEMSINKLQYDDWYKDIYKTVVAFFLLTGLIVMALIIKVVNRVSDISTIFTTKLSQT